jgi:hypothetical protein
VAVPTVEWPSKISSWRAYFADGKGGLGMMPLGQGVMGRPTNDRPMCPTCKHRMALARISPGERSFEVRTFECSTCDRTEQVSMSVDPMKTDAVGWLAGELKPPR